MPEALLISDGDVGHDDMTKWRSFRMNLDGAEDRV